MIVSYLRKLCLMINWMILLRSLYEYKNYTAEIFHKYFNIKISQFMYVTITTTITYTPSTELGSLPFKSNILLISRYFIAM